MVGADGLLGWVDVDDVGQFGWCGLSAHEPFGVGLEGAVVDIGAVGLDLGGGAVVDAGGGVEPDAGVAVLAVVPSEESDAEISGVVDAGEGVGERRG